LFIAQRVETPVDAQFAGVVLIVVSDVFSIQRDIAHLVEAVSVTVCDAEQLIAAVLQLQCREPAIGEFLLGWGG
jgi:hypothetical protein